MGLKVRSKLSEKNKYWISRHRYFELKHFCLQYHTWRKAYAALNEVIISSPTLERIGVTTGHGDPTAECAIAKEHYSKRIKMVERAAMDTDEQLAVYILKAVTEELSYTYLKTKLDIPCSRDTYYDRYRKFFWVLSKMRD